MIMSERKSSKKKANLKPAEIIAIQDLVLEYVLSNQWKDYQGFSRELSERILESRPKTEEDLISCVRGFAHPFYSFTSVHKKEFLRRFPSKQMMHRLSNLPKQQEARETVVVVTPSPKPRLSHVVLTQIFPYLEEVNIEEAKRFVGRLDMPERIIQDTLRTALRERGATNITERRSDTALEVADLEDFSLKIGQQCYSFVSVVKGYNSLKRRHVRWEDVAHQITKAYQGTQPNHVLLVLAKDPVDNLVTQLVSYGISVGNRNLVILIDPINLARFLHIRGML
jgi:hypothetical protein